MLTEFRFGVAAVSVFYLDESSSSYLPEFTVYYGGKPELKGPWHNSSDGIQKWIDSAKCKIVGFYSST